MDDIDEIEVTVTLTIGELDALECALEQRLEAIQERLKVKGGSEDYYNYFTQENQYVLRILKKLND